MQNVKSIKSRNKKIVLTPRQTDVLKILRDTPGRTTKRKVAEAMGISSPKAVQSHLKKLRKLRYPISSTNKGIRLIDDRKDKDNLEESSGTVERCLGEMAAALDHGELMKRPLIMQINFFKGELDPGESEKLTRVLTQITYLLVAGKTQKVIEGTDTE